MSLHVFLFNCVFFLSLVCCPGDSDDISAMATQRFTDGKKLPTLELIKGTLLMIADQMVTTISEVICDNASHDKAGQCCYSQALDW